MKKPTTTPNNPNNPNDKKTKRQNRMDCDPAILKVAQKMLSEAQTPEDIRAARNVLRHIHNQF